jgi:hypothetical protein
MLTKEETRVIFDKGKIGAGDIVELETYEKDSLFSKEFIKVCGIVRAVYKDELRLSMREPRTCEVWDNFVIGVKHSDRLKVLWKHPENLH